MIDQANLGTIYADIREHSGEWRAEQSEESTEKHAWDEHNGEYTGEDIGEQPETTPEKTKPLPVFDFRYGFYVAMGGFAVDVENLHNKLSPVTLTPGGVISLAKRGHFLDISPKIISDESKSKHLYEGVDLHTSFMDGHSVHCPQSGWLSISSSWDSCHGPFCLRFNTIHSMVEGMIWVFSS